MPSLRELWSGKYTARAAATEPATAIVPATAAAVSASEDVTTIKASGRAISVATASNRARSVTEDRIRARDPRSGRVPSRVLRYFADNNEWLQVAINRRKHQLSQANWHVQRIDDPEAKPDPKVVKAVHQLFNVVNPKRESFRSLMDMVIKDLLVLDAGVIEKQKTAGGGIAALYAKDGAAIAPDPEWDGTDPQATRYREIVNNQVIGAWPNDEMIYMMANPSTTSVIGWSPVETLINIIEAELFGENYDFDMLKQTAPSGILYLGAGVAPKQVEAFRDYYEGEVAAARDVAIFGGGNPEAKNGIAWIPMQRTPQELMRREYMKWLATKIAAVFEMDLGVFNLTETQHRTTADRAQNLTDEGHKSLALLVQEYITREIMVEFDDKHAFVFSDLNSRDEEAQSMLDERALKMGVIVPNEIRARDDLGDPLPYGDTYFLPGHGPWTGMSSQGQRPDDEGAINPIEEPDGSPLLPNPLPPTEVGHPAMPHKTQPPPPPEPGTPPAGGGKNADKHAIEVTQKGFADFRPTRFEGVTPGR